MSILVFILSCWRRVISIKQIFKNTWFYSISMFFFVFIAAASAFFQGNLMNNYEKLTFHMFFVCIAAAGVFFRMSILQNIDKCKFSHCVSVFVGERFLCTLAGCHPTCFHEFGFSWHTLLKRAWPASPRSNKLDPMSLAFRPAYEERWMRG